MMTGMNYKLNRSWGIFMLQYSLTATDWVNDGDTYARSV
jgi:hypothetical protein